MMGRSLPKKKPLPGVKEIVVISSGKGGVGKSTVAVNTAIALASTGKSIGLLDADIFGPSIPLMMNLHEQPLVDGRNLMIPLRNFGVNCMSMGLLVEKGPVVWRGPLVMSALEKLLKGTNWGDLDILVIDTPPGTGDVHLSLSQNIPISGVLLVTTPQIAALEITKRGAEMYNLLKIPIIGLIENMSHINCPNCNTEIDIFGSSLEKIMKDLNINKVISLPIERDVTKSCDNGEPYLLNHPESNYSKRFKEISSIILDFIEKRKTE